MSAPRFSRLRGAFRVGPEFFARAGALAPAAAPAPRGVVDALDDLSNPGLDVARVHPAIVPFFVDTAGLDLSVRSRWRFPFSLLWPLARPLFALVGQFVLPRRDARITTRALALDPAVDGRPDARGIVREYAGSGAVMQVVAYATHRRGATRYMHATFPLVLGHVAGVLRLDPIGADADGRLAVALTSAARDGDDAGVWYVTRFFAVRVPFGETLRFWAPGMSGAPADLDPVAVAGATLVARHEQRLCGALMVAHDYGFRPARGEGE
ncbi:MAG: uncharacterized protein JWM10_1593 [Myxococcaceae bacterium]|nr:uncharacterized protein [Myxococcaceae bacterium]